MALISLGISTLNKPSWGLGINGIWILSTVEFNNMK
jgi:hypothetical protein